ncbi:MAG: hypothetical protein AAGA48_16985 [Myxococcota bacterium]
MKRCPQCGAEYDNHVEYCFVDGTELSQLRTSATTPLIPPPAIQPQRSRALPLVLIGLAFVVATPLVVAGVVWFTGPTTIQNAPEDPLVAAPVPDLPVPVTTQEGAVRQVTVVSIPEGASVWEGNTELCSHTPCTIDQPDHAPARRLLRLEMGGYAPTDATLEKTAPGVRVSMRTRSSPKPPPFRAPPTPVPEPEGTADPGLIQAR